MNCEKEIKFRKIKTSKIIENKNKKTSREFLGRNYSAPKPVQE